MQSFSHWLEWMGIKRVDDLLFKVRSDLKGKATEVVSIEEGCSRCGQPNIMAWEYTLDGERKSYRYQSVCTVCQKSSDASKTTEEMMQQRQEALANRWYHIDKLDSSNFKNYEVVSKATEKALEEAMNYTKEIIGGNRSLNLLMMGSTGTGKTHLAKAVAKNAKEKGMNVAYIESTALFDLLKKTFGHERHNEKFFDEYKNFDLVVIDDVGLETKKLNEVSWTVTEWTKFINAREGKATVFTTNFDDLSLPDVIGARSFSRMYMNTKFIDLFTDDYRKKKVIK